MCKRAIAAHRWFRLSTKVVAAECVCGSGDFLYDAADLVLVQTIQLIVIVPVRYARAMSDKLEPVAVQ